MLKMKRWSKKLLGAISIFTLSLSLAACGGSSGGSDSPSSKTDTTKEAQAASEGDAAQTETQAQPAEEMRWLCVKEEEYDSDGELDDLIENTYNEYGNKITRTITSQGRVTLQDTYEYTSEQVLSSLHRFEENTFKNCTESGESTSFYNSYGFLESKQSVMTTVYNEGEPYEDSTHEYEYSYFFDGNGTNHGYIQRTKGRDYFTIAIHNYLEETEEVWENDLLVKKTVGASIYEYEYDEHGNVIKEIVTHNSGSDMEWMETIIYTYEEKLCKIMPDPVLPQTEEMEVIVQAVSTDTDGNILYGFLYSYDEYGNRVGSLGHMAQGDSFGEEYNEYDENGRVIRVWTEGLVADITYDADGKRIQEDFREELGGEIIVSATCEYDSNGNMIQMTHHALSDEYAEMEGVRQEYEYTADGQVAVIRLVDSNGTVLESEERTYDADGKVTTVTMFNGDGTIKAITTPTYANISVFTSEQ